jgi:asparagine synthase (glutamine-hydrolysing)
MYLPDDVLVKVDRAAMACSLETRAPFLDHRVVEFARRRPWRWKHRDGRSKWPLRALLERHVPHTLFERPKQGFTLPLGDWLRGPLQDWAESLLADSASAPWLDIGRIRRVWQAHLEGRANHQRELWTALMFLAWLEHWRGPSGSPDSANRVRRMAQV